MEPASINRYLNLIKPHFSTSFLFFLVKRENQQIIQKRPTKEIHLRKRIKIFLKKLQLKKCFLNGHKDFEISEKQKSNI